MKLTGYQLREALRRWELRRKAAEAQFRECIWVFPGEEKIHPREAGGELALCEDACAVIQEAQQRYNMIVPLGNPPLKSLAYGVKAIGGYGRLEKLWRDTAVEHKDRYEQRESRQRTADSVHAVRQISVRDALKIAHKAAETAGNIRAAIGSANNTVVESDRLNLTEEDCATFFGTE